MAAYDIRTLQERILPILLTMHRVCQEHNLRYYLAAGTMLGAVRHKGFIPWDDDIDIAMPREDYDRLMAHGAEWIPQPYELLCAEHTSGYPFAFAKVVNASTTLVERGHHSYVGGIYIDVFPIDGMTSNGLAQRLHFVRYSLLYKILYLLCRNPYKHGRGPSSWLPLLCQRLFTMRGMMPKLMDLQRKYSDRGENSLWADHDFSLRGIVPASVYGHPTPVTFEGHELMGVEHPDAYLAGLYGDYMTIPPGEKRKQHNFFFLDYDKPYREYVDTRPFVNRKNRPTNVE